MKKILIVIIIFIFGIDIVYGSVDSAKAYIAMDMVTGRVIEGKNYNSSMLIASITKIMTCLLAIESNKLDDIVVVDDTILDSYGSNIYLEIGEELSLRDLLYGLMLRSGNDASLMIAKYVSGDIDKFVSMMNDKALEIGMKNTFFVNPSGLDNDDSGNYSSAYDMALLTRYAMGYEEYRKIVGTKKYKLKTNKKSYIWQNKNKLLSYDYITGGKTGYTKKAKRTLVSTGSYNNIDIVVVTLNDSDDWNTHKYLYNNIFKNYIAYKVLNKDNFSVMGDYYYNNNLYIKNDVYIPLLKNESKKLVSYIKLEKKVKYKDDDLVGYDYIYLDDYLLYKENIYVKSKNITNKKNFMDKIKGLFR